MEPYGISTGLMPSLFNIVTRFEKSSLYSPQGEVSPGKGFLWGINQKKWGLEDFGGNIYTIWYKKKMGQSIYTEFLWRVMLIIISIAMLITGVYIE